MSARLQKVEEICAMHRVKALYVFGSRSAEMLDFIRGDAHQLSESQSDLDVGVLPHSPFSIEDKVNLTLELETFFNSTKVDLVVLPEADSFLAANVIRGERVYAEDPYLADEFDLFVLRRAGDLAELERQRMEMILRER
ncbi:nucleotidyltransferase domain-containing protein [Chloroflexi bacterium CFX6]|nr:nucleotidyltransferase domain-containing protein [Chloroflexi bacterium CFX6]